MLNELLQSLKKDEGLTLSVTKTEKGAKVALHANVSLNPDDHDEVALRYRAALARPMVLTLDADEDADACLTEHLSTFHEQHRATRNDLSEYEASIEAERQAAKDAQAKKAAKKKTAKKKAAKKTTTKAADSKPAEDQQMNETLF